MTRFIELGSLKFGKGQKYIFENLTKFDGGQVRKREIQYIARDGAEFRDLFFNVRRIEIRGHIIANNQTEMLELKNRLLKECNPKKENTLFYFNGIKKYHARVFADGLPEFGDRLFPSWYLPFILYFEMPSFYWESGEIITSYIFREMPLLTNDTVLPAIFSTRASGADVYNDGDTDVFPVIKIVAPSNTTGSIVLKNETANKSITLTRNLSANEIVTIDMANMKIYNQNGTNLLNNITAGDFWGYEIGENYIDVESNQFLNIYSEHRNQYLGV